MKRQDRRAGFRSPKVVVPTVLQMEETECGAASLCMVLAYYGKWISLDEARVACNVGRDGASAAAIVRAAKGMGLNARGMRVDVADLRELKCPVILFWEFNHFVVLEQGRSGGAVLNDPAIGRRVVPWPEFSLSFTGIALEFSPGDKFVASGAKPSLMGEGLQAIRTVRGELFVGLVAGVFASAVLLAMPTLTRAYVDGFGLPLAAHLSTASFIVLLTIGLVSSVSAFALRGSVLAAATGQVAVDLSSKMFTRMMSLPMDYFRQRHHSVIASRYSANDTLAQAFVAQSVIGVSDFVLVVGSTWMGIGVYPLVGITSACAMILAGGLVFAGVAVFHRSETLLAQATSRRNLIETTALYDVETVQANGEQSGLFERWAAETARISNTFSRVRAGRVLTAALPVLVLGAASVVIASLGTQAMLEGRLSQGSLLQIQLLAVTQLVAISRLARLAGTWNSLQPSLAARHDVMAYPIPASVRSAPAGGTHPERPLPALSQPAGQLELASVSYSVDQRHKLIDGISFRAHPGQRIALVGETGAGKTTIAHIIAGLQAPTSGEVLLDGHDRRDWPAATLAQAIAYVQQDSVVFAGTVRDNLSLWNPILTDDALLRAASDAEILTEIQSRPLGLDDLLDQDAPNWSGGQKQRLQLARALSTDPVILILDEATSALDTIVEAKIFTNLRLRGCVVVSVAHRLSTIRDADLIIVLEGGRICETGTHAELMSHDSRYSRMVSDE